jgi:hypothetical protein
MIDIASKIITMDQQSDDDNHADQMNPNNDEYAGE